MGHTQRQEEYKQIDDLMDALIGLDDDELDNIGEEESSHKSELVKPSS